MHVVSKFKPITRLCQVHGWNFNPKGEIFISYVYWLMMYYFSGIWVHQKLLQFQLFTPCIYIWAATWQNQRSDCAPSEDSDQLGHPPSLIWVFAVRMKKAWVLSYSLSAQWRLWSDWADAHADLSLCWAHSHSFGFVMLRLIYYELMSALPVYSWKTRMEHWFSKK